MPDKGISAIAYNFLNLPKQIQQNANVTNYYYRADGVKIKKKFVLSNASGTTTINTEYLDGFQYSTPNTEPIRMALEEQDDETMSASKAGEEEAFSWDEGREIALIDTGNPPLVDNMTLSFFPTAEGYYDFENFRYIYQYKDHLGNVRISYLKEGNDLKVMDTNDYYPFGMSFLKGSQATLYDPLAIPYNYKYNGKELQETGMYDYGARMYMPDIGKFGTHDPMSETTHDPYGYVWNNPITFIDPTGMAPETDYKLLLNGKVERIDPNDGSQNRSDDRLFATDSKGNVNNVTPVTVAKASPESSSIIGDLSKTSNGVSAGYTNNVDDAVKVFNFLNGNTKDGIEFGLARFFKNGSSENYLIATQHALDENTKGFAYTQKYIGGDNNLISYYHNHDGYNGNHPDEVGNQWGDGEGGDQRTRRIIQTTNLKVGDMLSRFFTVHQGLGNSLIEYTRFGHRNTGLRMTPANVKSINKIDFDNVSK